MSSNNNTPSQTGNPENIEEIKKRKTIGVALIILGLFLSFIFGITSGLYSYNRSVMKNILLGLSLIFAIVFIAGFVLLFN